MAKRIKIIKLFQKNLGGAAFATPSLSEGYAKINPTYLLIKSLRYSGFMFMFGRYMPQ
jgi:hypothetical protein